MNKERLEELKKEKRKVKKLIEETQEKAEVFDFEMYLAEIEDRIKEEVELKCITEQA